MIKVGIVSIDSSHPKAFAMCLEEKCMDMKYEYLAKESFRDEAQADWFVKRFHLKGKVEKIADMVDCVDIGFVQSGNWEKHLDQAMPFIEKGKPVFIDKPIVGSVKDINRLRELVANGAVIYGSSSVRHCKAIQNFLAIDVAERGDVLALYGCCGVDEFNYSIHVVECFSELAQSKAISGKFLGESVGCGGKKMEMYSIDFENGVTGTYQFVRGSWYPFFFTVVTTKKVFHIEITGDELYTALLQEIYREMTYGKSKLVDIETLINCTQAMLCGKKSKEEYNGGKVTIEMLGDSDKFDGYKFEKEYAAHAALIYKD